MTYDADGNGSGSSGRLELSPYDDTRDRVLLRAWANAPETAYWLTWREGPVTDVDLDGWRDADNATQWMLLRDGQPAGYGEIHCYRSDANQPYAQLVRLVVDPTRRRQGLGGALVRALVAQARALHPGSPIYARISPGNEAALLLYPFAGLVPLEPLPPGFDPNVVWLTAPDHEPPVPGGRIDEGD